MSQNGQTHFKNLVKNLVKSAIAVELFECA